MLWLLILTIILSSNIYQKHFAVETSQHVTNCSNKKQRSCMMTGCGTFFVSRKVRVLRGFSNSTYRSNSRMVAARYGQLSGRRICKWNVNSVVLHVKLETAVPVTSPESSHLRLVDDKSRCNQFYLIYALSFAVSTSCTCSFCCS
jgi:hypothetical protein